MRRRRTHAQKETGTRITRARNRTVPPRVVRIQDAQVWNRLRAIQSFARRIARSKRLRLTGLVLFQRFSTVLIVIGIVAVVFPFIRESARDQKAPPSLSESSGSSASSSGAPAAFGPLHIDSTLTTGTITSQSPTRVIIPSVSIDLPVTSSKLVNGYWEVSETTASYGLGSSYPGLLGNTVLFAHARAGLFLPLRNAKLNDTVYVLTNDRWHRYRIQSKTEVAPTQVQTIKPTPDETLTLFTCSGFMDSKRLVVVAKPDR